MRIVQVANFVSPTSGGLRTTLRHLAEGYADHGHEVVQVLPEFVDDEVETSWGRRVTLRSPALGSTGYRLLLDRSAVRRVLDRISPHVLEVHDRTTLRGLGRWARGRGIPALVVSHERLDCWLAQWLPARLPLTALAGRSNAGLARDFDIDQGAAAPHGAGQATEPREPAGPEHPHHRGLAPPPGQLPGSSGIRAHGQEDRVQGTDGAAVHQVRPQPGVEERQQRTCLEGTHRCTAAEDQVGARRHPVMFPRAGARGAGPRWPPRRRAVGRAPTPTWVSRCGRPGPPDAGSTGARSCVAARSSPARPSTPTS